MGGHRVPMRDDADLTMPGMVEIVADFLDALDLTDVALVVTDWGGPLFLTDIGRDKRVSRLVICPSEAFDNFPPGFPGQGRMAGEPHARHGLARDAPAQDRVASPAMADVRDDVEKACPAGHLSTSG